MKTLSTVHEVAAGTLRFTVECDTKGVPLAVRLPYETRVLKLDPEELERVAAALKSMRHTADDWRGVCDEHGYHAESVCPICEESRKKERAEKLGAKLVKQNLESPRNLAAAINNEPLPPDQAAEAAWAVADQAINGPSEILPLGTQPGGVEVGT